jgi:hypothetical protein
MSTDFNSQADVESFVKATRGLFGTYGLIRRSESFVLHDFFLKTLEHRTRVRADRITFRITRPIKKA